MNNSRNKKIAMVLIVSLVCAILAAVLIFNFLNPQRVTIYTFKDNYEAGTKITESMLTPIKADANILVGGADTDTSAYFITSKDYETVINSSFVLKHNVAKGTPLMANTLSANANNNIEVRMDPKAVAVTIPVNNITGVTQNIKPESRVNVYVTYNAGGTYLLLENVRVLNVAGDGADLSGITLELDNKNAVKIIDAVNTGKVYCGLVNSNGYVYENSGSSASDSKSEG